MKLAHFVVQSLPECLFVCLPLNKDTRYMNIVRPRTIWTVAQFSPIVCIHYNNGFEMTQSDSYSMFYTVCALHLDIRLLTSFVPRGYCLHILLTKSR